MEQQTTDRQKLMYFCIGFLRHFVDIMTNEDRMMLALVCSNILEGEFLEQDEIALREIVDKFSAVQ